MRTLKIASALLIVFVACGVPAAHAGAIPAVPTASYSADLSVTVMFTQPKGMGNPFTFMNVGGKMTPPCSMAFQGNAGNTMCMDPDSIFTKNNNTLGFTAGPVAGWSGPNFGFASATSFGNSYVIDVHNTTNMAQTETLMVGYSFTLSVMAGPGKFNAAGAAVSFGIDEGMAKIGPFMMLPGAGVEIAKSAPPNLTLPGSGMMPVNVTVPKGGDVFIEIGPYGGTMNNSFAYVSGEAKTPTPEPSAFIPLLTFATAACLRRRRLGRLK